MIYYTLIQNTDGSLGTGKLDGTLYPDEFELTNKIRIPLSFDSRKQLFGDFIRAIFNPQTLGFKPWPWRQQFARRVRDPAFKDAVKLTAEGIAAGSARLEAGLAALRSVGTMSTEVLQVLETFKAEFAGQPAPATGTATVARTVFFSVNPALACFDKPDTVGVTLLGDAGKPASVTGVVDSFANTPMIDAKYADKVGARETGITAAIKGIGGWIKVPVVSLRVRLGKGGLELPVDAAKVPDLRGLVGYDFLVSQGMKNYAKALGRPIA